MYIGLVITSLMMNKAIQVPLKVTKICKRRYISLEYNIKHIIMHV